MLNLAEKLTHTADRERIQILADIERSYDIDQNEKNSISRQLADTPRTNLSRYRTVGGRAKFLRTVSDLKSLPFLKNAAEQVANAVGAEWKNCSSETKTILINWYDGKVMAK